MWQWKQQSGATITRQMRRLGASANWEYADATGEKAGYFTMDARMSKAVVEVFGLRLSSYFAWLFWNALHLWKLVGFRKQLQVALDWGMAQFFPRDSSIMRRVSRCPVCAHHTPYRERDAA